MYLMIHYLYRLKTGKETYGIRLWKRLWNWFWNLDSKIFAVITSFSAIFALFVLIWMGPGVYLMAFDDLVGIQLQRIMGTTVVREMRYVDRFYNGDGIAGSPLKYRSLGYIKFVQTVTDPACYLNI